jgi:hypothetical protein
MIETSGRDARDSASASAARLTRPSASTAISSIASREAAAGADGRMLDRRHQEFVARPFLGGDLDSGRERQHVGFGAARGEDHVGRPGADQAGYVLARMLDQIPGGAPFGMHRGGVAGERQGLLHGAPTPPGAAAPWRSNRNKLAPPCS